MSSKHLRVYRPVESSTIQRIRNTLQPLAEYNQAALFRLKSEGNIGMTIIEGKSYSPPRNHAAAASGFPESAAKPYVATVTDVALLGFNMDHRAIALKLGGPEDPDTPDPWLTDEAAAIATRLNRQLKKERGRNRRRLAEPVIPHITVAYANARLSEQILEEEVLPLVKDIKVRLGRVATNPAVAIGIKRPPLKRAPTDHPHAAPQITQDDIAHVRPGGIPLGFIQSLRSPQIGER